MTFESIDSAVCGLLPKMFVIWPLFSSSTWWEVWRFKVWMFVQKLTFCHKNDIFCGPPLFFFFVKKTDRIFLLRTLLTDRRSAKIRKDPVWMKKTADTFSFMNCRICFFPLQSVLSVPFRACFPTFATFLPLPKQQKSNASMQTKVAKSPFSYETARYGWLGHLIRKCRADLSIKLSSYIRGRKVKYE